MPTNEEILNAELPDLATATGNTPPAIGIYIKQTYAELAAQIARALSAHPNKLFIRNGEYGTVIIDTAAKRYLFHPIDQERFTTWLEEQDICYFYSWGKKPKPTKDNPDPQPQPQRTNLSPAQARTILASDSIRFSTPEIKEISPLRLPIAHKCKDNLVRFTPAPVGYDPTTKI